MAGKSVVSFLLRLSYRFGSGLHSPNAVMRCGNILYTKKARKQTATPAFGLFTAVIITVRR